MTTPAPLFLDAARLGAMSPTAQLAARDFARLAGEGLSTLYWEEFFRGRFSGASRLPGLAQWHGITGLQSDIRRLLAAPATAPVLFASRTAALVHTALDLLALRSHRIFTTDSLWPSYRDRLDTACRRHARTIVTLPVRARVQEGRWSGRRLIGRIVRQFAEARCEGAFLSSLSHDGIRLPLAPIIAGLRERHPGAFIVVDGAQEFAHVPVRLAPAPCDVYIAGCHKWLGAHQPLGLAVLANSRTAAAVDRAFEELDDPLFRYVQNLDGGIPFSPSETVNLTPLICAHGALTDSVRRNDWHRFRDHRRNAVHAARMAKQCAWKPSLPSPGLRSGILLLRSEEAARRALTPDEVLRDFNAAGVVPSAYSGGVIRLSFPARPLQPAEWGTLRQALDLIGSCCWR